MVYMINDMTPEMVEGNMTADLAGWAVFYGISAMDKNRGIFVKDIRKLTPTGLEMICDVVLARESATVTLAAIAEPERVDSYIERVIGGTLFSAIRRVLWAAIPYPSHPDAERVRGWLEAQDQETRLTELQRFELKIVRGWPEAKGRDERQDEYCIRAGYSTDTLQRMNKKYKAMGYKTGW